MTKQIYTCPEEQFPHYDNVSYRIEIDLSNPRETWQRHIWTKIDGSVVEEDWICVGRETPESLAKQGFVSIAA